MHDLLALYDREMRINIEYPGVRKDRFPQLVRFIRPAPGMNFIAYSRLDEAHMDEIIQQQIADLAPMPQPFSWHVYAHDQPASLQARLLAHGFAPDDDPDAVMTLAAEEAQPILRQPILAEVRRLEHRDQLEDVILVEQHVLGGNFSWIKGRLGDHLDIPGYLSVYIAYVEGQPASVGWVYFNPRSQFASLFGAATRREYRKRGLYSALLAARVQEAISRGYAFVATGASPMSRPILLQNGFRLLTHAYAHEWKGKGFLRGMEATIEREPDRA